MPVVKTPSLRLRLIDACLQRRQVRWTADALFKKVADDFLRATGRTFSKSQFNLDLKAMREEYNAPLVHSRDHGYYYEESSFSLFKSPLVSDDAAVLRQALAALKQFQGLGLSEELSELAGRVEAHLQTSADQAEELQIILFEQVPDYVGTPFLQPLYSAIQRRQVLQLHYRPFGLAEALTEVVHPQYLKEFNRRWFLLAASDARH